MSARIYVAAPYEDAPHVRELHVRLRRLGITPTSTWADEQTGPENFAAMKPGQLRAIAEANDSDIESSDAMLVLARPGVGGEMFAEARYASTFVVPMPIYWVGRLILSAWRANVVRCKDLDDAVARLVLR